MQFPHHENEIAQSEAASGETFANYWMHVGLLQINNEKMSKSTGNFFTISDVLKKYQPEVIRYFLLSSHYRSSLNYTEDNLANAIKALTRLYQALAEFRFEKEFEIEQSWLARFQEAMNDDFNTPIALSVLFDLGHEVHKTKDVSLAYTLKSLANTLGLLEEEPQVFFQQGTEKDDIDEIEQLIQQRKVARKNKDWARSDEIRDLLLEKDIELADSAEGTTWRKIK